MLVACNLTSFHTKHLVINEKTKKDSSRHNAPKLLHFGLLAYLLFLYIG